MSFQAFIFNLQQDALQLYKIQALELSLTDTSGLNLQ